MAILKMKKLRVVAMSDHREDLLKGLLHLGCVEISEPDEKLADPVWAALLRRENSRLLERRSEITDAQTALEALRRYGNRKSGMFTPRPQVTEEHFLNDDAAQKAKAVTDDVKGLLQELTALQAEEGRLQSRLAALRPWKSLDMPLEQEGTAHAVMRLSVCPATTELGEIRTRLGAEELFCDVISFLR